MPKKVIPKQALSDQPGDRYLAPRAAGDRIGCSPRTLIRWEENCDPPRIKSYRLPNGERRYLESDILALLRSELPVSTPQQQAQAALARTVLREKRGQQPKGASAPKTTQRG